MLKRETVKRNSEAILSGERTSGKRLAWTLTAGCRHLAKTMGKYSLADDSEYAYHLAKWLRENYPALEEAIKGDCRHLKNMRNILKGEKYPYCFEYFSRCLEKHDILDKEKIIEEADFLNSETEDFNLSDGMGILPLFRSAVYEKLIDTFEAAFEKQGCVRDELEKVEALYHTLDELSLVLPQQVLRKNPVEKLLMSDPARVYETLSEQTKQNYRENLIRLSKRQKISQSDMCKRILAECEGKSQPSERHIGTFLCDRPDGGMTYLVLAAFLTALFTTLLCLVSPIMLVSVLSVYECVKLLLDKFFVRYFVRPFHLPRLSLSEIPDSDGVMVVITTLLTGGKNDERVFENLEKMYFSNGGKNVYFGLLCDLCDSSERYNGKDAAIIENADKRICELRKRYGDVFFLFVRQREYSDTEECFIAPERKRGAVNALVSFLCQKSDVFDYGSIKPCENVCNNIRYVFTLDSDTNLAFDCLKTMVGIMKHPMNAPVTDKRLAVVTKGYGILQPCMNTSVDSSMKSFFSRVMCGHGGTDVYSSGGSDKNMPLFGRSIFCGKGMFDKNAFYDTLCACNEFPLGTVLSHDAPEGARLRCAYVSDVVLTDSFPSEELSYYKRQHRWIRGDIANAVFLSGSVKNASGRKIRNRIGVFSKFFMLENIVSALLPVFTLLSVLAAVLCERHISALIVTVTFSAYILPFVHSLFVTGRVSLLHNARRLFFSKGIYTGIWTCFMQMLFRICAIPKSASVSADAVVRSIYRLTFSKKKTLEWMTAAQSDEEKGDGLLGYVKKNLFCAFCGCVVFVMTDGGFLRLVSLMWLFLPVFAYHSGKEKQRKKRISEENERTLVRYAEHMWHFFEENANADTNHLPTDNISYYPEKRMSPMTSPTNIGLYLVSVCVSRKLGFIDTHSMEKRIRLCVETLDALPKYHGLLYNWYDIYSKKPMMPMFVSSVDLGNYVACLECVKSAVIELWEEMTDAAGIFDSISSLLKNTDLKLLFDDNKKQFYVGITEGKDGITYDKNRYDMLMSEARILSFCAVAKRSVSSEHMQHLARRFTEGRGYMGLASWSGTVFEYFMPELFLPSKEGTLIYETLRFCHMQQKLSGVVTEYGRIFGISESCYNELDAYSNYKYFAFGVGKTSLRVFKEQKVFSPYSCFLLLPMSCDESLSSLEAMKKIGMYGEYGFYESVDFERHPENKSHSTVECFMSHHLGMSICAVANAVLDGQVSRWFLAGPEMSAASALTEEKIPYNAYVKRISRKSYDSLVREKADIGKTVMTGCNTARLFNDRVSVYAKKDRLYINYSDMSVSIKNCFENSLRSFGVYVCIEGHSFPFGRECSLSTDGGKIVYTRSVRTPDGNTFEASLSVTAGSGACDYVRLRVRVRQLSGEKKKIGVRLAFRPDLFAKERSDRCRFFEEKKSFLQTDGDSAAVYKNVQSNVCMYSRVTFGDNALCEISEETARLEGCAVKQNGVYECRFVISMSYNEKCARDGMLEAEEQSFDMTSDALLKNAVSTKSYESKRNGVERGVLGAYTMTRDMPCEVLYDSREYPYMLLSGKRFSTLVLKDGLGFSFCNDVNKKRVTEFYAVGNKSSERLVFGSDKYDLCKNCTDMTIIDGKAVYNGRYGKYLYTVEVYIPENQPFKVICVSTDCSEAVEYEVNPCFDMSKSMRISGGMAFFCEDFLQSEIGFVYGYGKDLGSCADYSISDGVTARIDVGCDRELSVYDYVFVLGKAGSLTDAEDCRRIVTENETELRKGAKAFSEKLHFDKDKMNEDLKNALEKLFVFPRDNVCYRGLVEASGTVSWFDCLLLSLCDGGIFREKYVSMVEKRKPCNGMEYILCAAALCEYIRTSGDTAFADVSVSGETLYRFSLFCLSRASEDCTESLSELLSVVCRLFSRVCFGIGDVRTSVYLDDKAKNIGALDG